MKNKTKNKIITWVEIIIVALIIFVSIFASYKWQEYKLEHVWGIEDPTPMQVWISIGK